MSELRYNDSFGLILDVDGTLLNDGRAVEGSIDFIDQAKSEGIRILLLTNRTATPKQGILDELRNAGIEWTAKHLLTASEAAADRVEGKRVFTIGERGLRQELARRGCVLTDERPDYVVVGLCRSATYRDIERATRHIHAGASLLATNLDPCFFGSNGVSPGAGAIVAAIATASGEAPVVVGKPGRQIFERALKLLGTPSSNTLVVGDNLQTDILGGSTLGLTTVLLATCPTPPLAFDQAAVTPDWTCNSYEELSGIVSRFLDGRNIRPRR